MEFTGPAPVACPDVMPARQPFVMADSEGALPPPVTTFQECPGSATCSTVLENRLHFSQQDPSGFRCCSLVLRDLCPDQHVWPCWPTHVYPSASLGAGSPTAERCVFGIWRGSEPPGGTLCGCDNLSFQVGTPEPPGCMQGPLGGEAVQAPLAPLCSLSLKVGSGS